MIRLKTNIKSDADFDGVMGYTSRTQCQVWSFRLTNGLQVLMAHGHEDGHLSLPPAWIEQLMGRTDVLIFCCYPAAVRNRYPGLNVQGRWNESTTFIYYQEIGEVWLFPTSQRSRLPE